MAMAKPESTSPACTKCGQLHNRVTPWGKPEELCEACDKARLAEINRVYEYYEQHPEKCCCFMYLGRACCLAPQHGDKWRVNGIDDGERFYFLIHAHNRKEDFEVGTAACQDIGEEFISVRKFKDSDEC